MGEAGFIDWGPHNKSLDNFSKKQEFMTPPPPYNYGMESIQYPIRICNIPTSKKPNKKISLITKLGNWLCSFGYGKMNVKAIKNYTFMVVPGISPPYLQYEKIKRYNN